MNIKIPFPCEPSPDKPGTFRAMLADVYAALDKVGKAPANGGDVRAIGTYFVQLGVAWNGEPVTAWMEDSRDNEWMIEWCITGKPLYHLLHTSAVGFYYVDQFGDNWSTRQIINGHDNDTCVTCGKETDSGYVKGMLGSEEFHCGCDVVTHY